MPEQLKFNSKQRDNPPRIQGEHIPLKVISTDRTVTLASLQNQNVIHQPVAMSAVPKQPSGLSPRKERWSESPQREIIEITSSLTVNNLSKYAALARAKRKLMFVARKTDQNQLALHSLRGDGKLTPDVIVLKDNQIRALTPNEAHQLLDRKR